MSQINSYADSNKISLYIDVRVVGPFAPYASARIAKE